MVDNIRMDLQEVGCGYMDWIRLAQDRDRWRTLVSGVMNLRVPWNAGNFLTSCKPVSFSRRTLHHGMSKYEKDSVCRDERKWPEVVCLFEFCTALYQVQKYFTGHYCVHCRMVRSRLESRTKGCVTFVLSTDKHNNPSKISSVIILKGFWIRFR